MSEDYEAITVTIKYAGEKYLEPWIVMRGATPEAVIQNLIDTFGLDSTFKEGTLHEAILASSQAAKGASTVLQAMGGTVIPNGGASDPLNNARLATPGGLSDGSGGETPENPHAAILEAIKGCENVDQLKMLWATHTDAFTDADVMAAYKDRGKSLVAKSN